MAKKKSSQSYLEGYIPAGFDPQINAQQIIQIPPYEDSGIKFQGFSKKLTGGGNYQLYPQVRRTQGGTIFDNTVVQITGPRIDLGKKFYVASIHVDASCTSDAIVVSVKDGTPAANNVKYTFTLSKGQQHFDIDLSNSPREFVTDNITIDINQTLGAVGDFFQINLIGWAE